MTILFLSCSEDSELKFPNPPKSAYNKTKYSFLRDEESSVETLDAKEQVDLLSVFTETLEGLYITDVKELYKSMSEKGPLYGTSLKDISIASRDLFVANPTIQSQVLKDLNDNFIKIATLGDYKIKNRHAEPGKSGWVGYINGNANNVTQVDAHGLALQLSLRNMFVGIALLDQIINEHIGYGVLRDPELRRQNDNQTLVSPYNYTLLEHHWDMAYELSKSKYIRDLLESDFVDFPFLSGINKRVNNAFIAGREAITEYDYLKAESQAGIIYQGLSQAMAAQIVYLLRVSKPDVTEKASNSFNRISEAYGFIYALIASRRMDGSRYIDRDTALRMMKELSDGKNGFWDNHHLNDRAEVKGSIENICLRLIALFELWEPGPEEVI
ncbi:DUF4856 domain-containing protein [Porphyromonas pogonae]|nr:DUF4856 domain-containing protein [Porphyromonas pogonae]